jgi:hypothetical protein
MGKAVLRNSFFESASLVLALIPLLLFGLALPASAQDDVTTQNGASGPDGAFITGPASNPLSFLNGPVYRTFGSTALYDLPDFRPIGQMNTHLPKWIAFEAEERLRFEAYRNGSFRLGNDDAYFLNRFRYQMDLRPATWLKVVSQVQDARPISQRPPIGPPNENTWDLKLAYAEVGDPEKQWISVRIGRQLINYNNTIISNSEWRNQGRSYDAVATNLHYGRFRLGIFAALPVITRDFGVSRHQRGNDIFGMYGRIDRLIPGSVLEPFVLRRAQPNVTVENPGANTKATQHENAYGLRLKGKATGQLDYSIEAILERGSDGSNPIRAWATSFGAAYPFSAVQWRPRIFGQYDFASGDDQPHNGVHSTFDTMYPTAHDRFGITDQFGWQNINAIRGGMTIEPHRRWTISAQYLNFWLASAADGLYNTSGGLLFRDVTGKSGTHVGEEFDVYTWYELNRHINIGTVIGHLMAGSFIARSASPSNYTYPYFAINFKDNGKSRSD